jgi:hypothetical protein
VSTRIACESPYLPSNTPWSSNVAGLSAHTPLTGPLSTPIAESRPQPTEDLLEVGLQASPHDAPLATGTSTPTSIASPHRIESFGGALAEIADAHDAGSVTRALVRRPVDTTSEYLLSGQSAATHLDAHAPRHFPGFGLLAGALLASSMFGALVPAAHAAEATPASSSQGKTSMVSTSSLAHTFGLKADVLQNLPSQDVAQTLETLPGSAKSAYRELTPQHKQLFFDKLQGSTSVFFVTVNNRDAFVKGSVAGFDTFDQMQKKLDESISAGKIDPNLKPALTSCIEMFRQMSPAQRDAVVHLLEADLGHTLN